jgi:hypothetical protein
MTETPLTPLPLTAEQIDVIQSLFPQAFLIAPMPAVKAPARVVVKPAPDSRLEGLLTLFKSRQEASAAAETAFKDLKRAILAELEALYPEAARPTEAYEVPATALYPQLTFQYKEVPYLPAPRIREFLPAVYDAFHGVKRYWELRETGKGGKR